MSNKRGGGGARGGGSARERARRREEQARRRKRDRNILIAVATAIVVLVGAGIAFQAWRTSRAPSAAPSASGSFAPVPITDGQPIMLGKADAPVTITLYEDFHCPHCAEFEQAFGPTITAAQNAGTVQVALFPMAFIDEGSTSAANAMACAAEAGFGQAYYSGLFANHTLQWSSAQLVSLADQITGDQTPDSFTTCVEQGKHAGWVASIDAAAKQAGVNQTPTLFVNDKPVDLPTLTVDGLDQLIADAATK